MCRSAWVACGVALKMPKFWCGKSNVNSSRSRRQKQKQYLLARQTYSLATQPSTYHKQFKHIEGYAHRFFNALAGTRRFFCIFICCYYQRTVIAVTASVGFDVVVVVVRRRRPSSFDVIMSLLYAGNTKRCKFVCIYKGIVIKYRIADFAQADFFFLLQLFYVCFVFSFV